MVSMLSLSTKDAWTSTVTACAVTTWSLSLVLVRRSTAVATSSPSRAPIPTRPILRHGHLRPGLPRLGDRDRAQHPFLALRAKLRDAGDRRGLVRGDLLHPAL